MSSTKKELFSGVFYLAIAKYSGMVISLIVVGILSRLLTSADFGIVAIATVIITFFAIFTDIGLSTAIIQKKELTQDDLSNIFSFTIFVGLGISVVFFACAQMVGSYYQSQILTNICKLLAIHLFLASANIVPNALFYKNKAFKHLAVRTLSIQLFAGVIAIAVASTGGGLYALLINPLVSGLLVFIVSYNRYPQKIRFTLGLHSIRKIFSYSAYQFLFNIINYFSRNLDKLLIGKYMTMSQLGYYEKSYRTMMLPMQNITQVVTPVMHPVLSDYQNHLHKLAQSYEKIIRFLAFVGFPLTALLYFTAREIILILYGGQWIDSIPVFRVLALSVGIQIILSSSGSIFQAANDTKSLFFCGVFSSILNVAGVIVGIWGFGSLVAIAWCFCITFSINFIQCYWMMYRITMKRKLSCFFKQLLSPALAGLIVATGLYSISQLLNDSNIFISFTIKCVLSLTISVSYIQLTKEYDIIRAVKKKIKRQFG